ncbi:MAG: ECF-type sigma factor [Bryobacteraceae bacterium]|jgi:RNA polymerase sigma factor (TIGR02999 family)
MSDGTELDGERRQALDAMFSVAYEELRRIAASVQHSGPNVNVSTSTLINEAWLKLVNSSKLELESKLHFTCVAAKAMRQIVVDIARRRGASKRAALFVTFDEALGVSVSRNRDVIALDAALDELARLNPRQARAVELRFFGGLNVTEMVNVLGVSESTIDRDWRVARAWLEAEIARGR